jgi:hypothetical protein
MKSENRNKAICILCLEIIDEIIDTAENITDRCPKCNFEWEYDLKTNSFFLNQLLKLIKLYTSNEISINTIKLAIDNWINELDLSIQSSNIKINIPIPSVIKKAIDYSILSLTKLKSALESINIENLKESVLNDVIKNDELTLKVFKQISKLLKRINNDKYYILEQYKKEKIDIENINIEEINYE